MEATLQRHSKVPTQCVDCGQIFESGRKDSIRCQPCRVLNGRQRAKDFEARERKLCPVCGVNTIARRSAQCRPCDNHKRIGWHTGENNPNWHGGRGKHKDGYIYVINPRRQPGQHRYRGEHIIVWEDANNRPLPHKWVVHHLNGIKDDNRLENLMGMPSHHHHSYPREALVPYEQRIAELEGKLMDAVSLRTERV